MKGDKREATQRIAEAIERIRPIESALKKELHQEYYPPIAKGFSYVLERLTVIKNSYCQILTILEGVKDAYPKENRSNIAGKIQGAKNAYIATDQAIETVKGIQQALRLAPTRFFD
jgi:hypothetical protein